MLIKVIVQYSLAILSLSFIITSCGNFESTQEVSAGKENFKRTRFGKPIIYSLADKNCTAERALKDLGFVQVWLKKNKSLVKQWIDLRSYSGRALKGPAVSEALYGVREETTYCDVFYAGHNCNTRKIISSGKKIHICRKEGSYPRESIENAALASLYALKKSYESHQLFSTSKIKAVKLLVLPYLQINRVEKNGHQLERKERVRTDNAMWSYDSYFKQAYISMLPSSEERQDENHSSAFWEDLVSASHEFGHHVFYHNAPDLVLKNKDKLSSGFASPVQRSIDLLNEAYADLWAYQTFYLSKLNKDSYYFANIGTDRNPNGSLYSNGSQKSLSEYVVWEYFNESSHMHNEAFVDNPSSLEFYESHLDYTDSHTLGAVVAYAVSQCFAYSDDEAALGYFLTRWPGLMESALVKSEEGSQLRRSGQFFLQESLSLAVKACRHANTSNSRYSTTKTLNWKQCSVLKDALPLYKNSYLECN